MMSSHAVAVDWLGSDHTEVGQRAVVLCVEDISEGMRVYSVISQFGKLDYTTTDVFVAQNVEDAARKTYERWAADLGVSEVGSNQVKILSVALGDNDCDHVDPMVEEERALLLKAGVTG
jgi:hypothetical protein